MTASAHDTARELAHILDACVFPVRVFREDAGKWAKCPLTKHGHLDGHRDPDAFEPWRWARANGVGICTGGGLYALDVDDGNPEGPPARWLKARGLHPSDRLGQTRVHGTPSRGFHMLYRTSEPYLDLRSRVCAVSGLDTRGAGGWIAYGENYRLVRDKPLAFLPPKVCAELHEGAERARALSGPAEIAEPERMPATELKPWLELGFKIIRFRLLWTGDRRIAQNDGSRSGNDWHVALLLALLDAPQTVTANLLLFHFRHGQCGPGSEKSWPARLRAAVRTAYRAARVVEAAREVDERLANAVWTADDELMLRRLQAVGFAALRETAQ